MRIVLQNSVFFPNVIGGAERSTHLLALGLSARGHEVDVLASTGRVSGPRGLESRVLAGVSGRVHEAASAGRYDLVAGEAGVRPRRGGRDAAKALHHAAGVYSPRWRRLTRDLLREIRPDVLLTNVLVGTTPSVWRGAREAGVPVLHHLRDHELLCPSTTLLHPDGTTCTGRSFPCNALRASKRPATRWVDRISGPSQYILERHREAGFFVGHPSRVIPNAVPDRSPDRVRRDGPSAAVPPFQVLFLGDLEPYKGADLVLALAGDPGGFDPGPTPTFAFAGTGSLRPAIERLAAEHPERVRYHEFLGSEERDRVLARTHLLLVPSRCFDNCPRVILEAYRFGVPVVGARRGGIPELVVDGITGSVVEPEAGPLRAAVAAYANHPTLWENHAAAAWERAANYSADRQLDAFEEEMRRAVNSSRRAGR